MSLSQRFQALTRCVITIVVFTPARKRKCGRPERALIQLNTLLKRPEVDYYARARVEARIAAITPSVLELKRLGIRDEELERR